MKLETRSSKAKATDGVRNQPSLDVGEYERGIRANIARSHHPCLR